MSHSWVRASERKSNAGLTRRPAAVTSHCASQLESLAMPGNDSRAARLRLICGQRCAACQTDSARPRRCADPGRSVAADSPGNPPIRRVVCLPRARGYPPGRGDTGRTAVGRAGSFNSGKNAVATSVAPVVTKDCNLSEWHANELSTPRPRPAIGKVLKWHVWTRTVRAIPSPTSNAHNCNQTSILNAADARRDCP